MAPRKRRGRNSAAHAHKSVPSSSATNSSSRSSPAALRVDQDPSLGSTPNTLHVDRTTPDAVLPSRNGDSREPSHVTDVKTGLKSRNPSGSSLNPSREPSVSLDRAGNENHSGRAEALIKAYQQSTANIEANPEHFTIAGAAMHLYHNLIDWAISEVAVQFKQNVHRTVEVARQRRALAVSKDIDNGKGNFGSGSRLLYSDKNVTVECSNCASNISASRYAQHVEKCLGRGGRMSSRAASARLRASAERSEKETDGEEHHVKRRRHSAEPADTGSMTAGYSKRRRASPVPSGGSGGASYGAALQHGRGGLPPSGRTRASPQ